MSIESAIILLPTLGRVDIGEAIGKIIDCLLYTSDAADERSSVDLGGRRIIKKKKRIKKQKKKEEQKKKKNKDSNTESPLHMRIQS